MTCFLLEVANHQLSHQQLVYRSAIFNCFRPHVLPVHHHRICPATFSRQGHCWVITLQSCAFSRPPTNASWSWHPTQFFGTGTPTRTPGAAYPRTSPNPQMKGIPNHKLLRKGVKGVCSRGLLENSERVLRDWVNTGLALRSST